MSPDLDVRNIGFEIPRIEQYTEDDLLDWMDNPTLIAIVPQDHSVQNDSLPKYLVSATGRTARNYMPKNVQDEINDHLVV
jgi:hypothetical protein